MTWRAWACSGHGAHEECKVEQEPRFQAHTAGSCGGSYRGRSGSRSSGSLGRLSSPGGNEDGQVFVLLYFIADMP